MWILAPLRAANKDGSAGDTAGAEAQNSAWFLTSGRCTLGRPSQKGGTTGKADIIILGDSSVSSLHASLDITPASNPNEQPSITITDNKSKFGTTLQGEKLPENTPTPLADGQDLRLGYKSKFRLVWQAAPLLHCPHPLPEPPAAAISSLFAQAGASAAPWGPQVTHVLAAEGQPLSAAVLCAALQEVAVVGVSWLQALTSKTAWRAALPSVEEHRVSKFTYLSSSGTKGQQQQQHKLDLAAWAAAGSGNLLQGFSILVDVGQAALLELCMLLGAEAAITATTPQPSPTHLYIVSSSGSSEQLQRHGKAASVPEELLLACVAQRDVAALKQQLDQHAASLAAEEDHSETVATSAHGTGSEGEEDDGAEVTGLLLPAAGTQRRAAAAAHAAAAAAAAVAVPAAAATPPRGKQRRGAAATASPASATRGKSRKRQEPAAAAEPASTPPSKRRKGRVAGAADPAAAAEVEHSPSAAAAAVAATNTTTTAAAAGGGGRSRHGSRAQPAATQHTARGARVAAAGEEGVVMMDLVAADLPAGQHGVHQQQQHQSQQQPQPAVVNFKAFRRKGQAPAAAAAIGPAVVVAVEPFTADDAHPDTELFLREEEQRRKRMQKADELFNAAVGPSKSRAGAGTGTRSSRR